MTQTEHTFHIEPDRQLIKSHSPASATVLAVRWTLGILVIVAMASAANILLKIQQQSGSATSVRVAARQQALAERLAAQALTYHYLPEGSSQRADVLSHAARLHSEFGMAQNALVEGSSALGVAAPTDQLEKDLLSAASGSFARIQRAIERLVDGRLDDSDLDGLAQANEEYQSRMATLVKRLEDTAEASIQKLMQTVYISAGSFLFIFFAAWLLLLRPKAKKLLRLYNELLTFRMAIDYAAEHMVITDPDGKVLYANSAAERITGFSRKEMTGRKVGGPDLWGGLMGAEFYEKLWKKIKRDRQIFTGVLTNRRKNGERYTAEATISPVLDAHGKVLYFLGIERDLTHHAPKR